MSEIARGAPLPLRRSALLLLRSCSIRFAAYYWVGYAVGMAAVERLTPATALLGVPMWLACCLGTESVNRLADREADVLNRPERTALCEEFGWRRLAVVAWLSWACFLLMGLVLFLTGPTTALPVMLLVDVALAVGYSIGPALKRHPVLAPLMLITPLVNPMLTGWATEADPDTLWSPVLPAAAVLAAFTLGLSGIKDITDVEGDRRLGYSSLWLSLMRLWRGTAVYVLTGAPFALLTVFALTGALPMTALTLLPAVVVSVLVVSVAGRAVRTADREAAREVMHQYTFYFLLLVLLVAVPGAPTVWAVAAAVCHWLAASRTLHWSDGLTPERMRRWTALVAPSHRSKEFS
ncbi:UbiA family prenyltransferase [Streptomyces physcomitrii]|uniref:UbiA family prenyltransferase n=1 Tax=Streptomyces physcomitrii TaxID=2724184 RepID=A0ABX1GZK2_9ACTN|nr:UbiA family prenyltransferase [Streptomyces physcomitrii]NKI41529.1 UbiA family prenyltransferase [Streptomyces physcomitrii]